MQNAKKQVIIGRSHLTLAVLLYNWRLRTKITLAANEYVRSAQLRSIAASQRTNSEGEERKVLH